MIEQIKSLLQEYQKQQKWLTIKEAVRYSTLSESSIRRAIKIGKLRASKPIGKYVIRQEWLEEYLTS